MDKKEEALLHEAEEQSEELANILEKSEESIENVEDTEVSEDLEDAEDAEGEQEIEDETDMIDNPELLGNESDSIKSPITVSRYMLAGLAGLVLVILAVLAITSKFGKHQGDREEVLQPQEGFELTSQIENDVNKVRAAISKLYEENAYITMHIGANEDEVIYLMFNSNKECYIESGYDSSLAVSRKDYKAVALTNPVEVVEDMHLLNLIERVADMAYTGYAEISSADTESDSGLKTVTYTILVPGKHNIRKIYTVVSEEYANTMMESIFQDDYDATRYTDDYVDNTDTDSLTIEVVVGENGEIGANCKVHIAGFDYINWWFDGYIKLDGYELHTDWYGVDNDKEKWVSLAEELQQILSNNIEKYIENNLTDAEKQALEGEKSTESGEDDSVDEADETVSTPNLHYTRPDGELSEDEEAWWNYIEAIQKKIENGEELTEQEKSDYYALPPSGAIDE